MTPSALQLSRYLPESMVVLHDSTLSAATASFDVQNLPATYRHLLIVGILRTSEAVVGSSATIQLNNDSGANYDGERLTAADTTVTGIGTVAGTSFAVNVPGASAHSGAAGAFVIEIPAYANTTFHKSALVRSTLVEDTAADARLDLRAIRWRDTSAINRVTITGGSGSNLAIGSRLTIYGLGGTSITEIAGIDGWTNAAETWTYGSATTFTIPGDIASKYPSGTRIKLTQTTVKYFTVVAALHSGGTTTVTITGGSDYTLANATISDPFYSYAASPQGYPGWFNFAPAVTGITSDTSVAQFSVVGRTCTVTMGLAGTSDNTAKTFTLPIAIGPTGTPSAFAGVRDNGVSATTAGRVALPNSGSTVSIYKDGASGAWTASGAWFALATFSYFI